MNLFEVYSFYSGCSCCIRVSSDSYSNSEVSKSNRTIQLDFISKFLMITDNLMHINLNQTRVKWMIQVKSLRNDSLNLSRVETIRPTGYTSLIQYSIIYWFWVQLQRKVISYQKILLAENTAIMQTNAITFLEVSDFWNFDFGIYLKCSCKDTYKEKCPPNFQNLTFHWILNMYMYLGSTNLKIFLRTQLLWIYRFIVWILILFH